MALTTALLKVPAAGASNDAPAAARVWAALWVIYIVWGSTYLAIRVMVRTMPALLGAGVRFAVAGAVMLAVLSLRRRIRLERGQVLPLVLLGILLPGANAVVTVAEKEVPSGLAALLVAAVPLWVILLRRAGGEHPAARSVAAVLVGFVGVALLMLPGEQTAGASLLAMLAIVGAALMWASGSYTAPKLRVPPDLLVSTAWQMLFGGLVISAAGLLAGEASGLDPSAFSGESLLAFGYLIAIGSWFAYTSYAWLLQNAPVSKVATYAYVNPVIAIFLGAVLLDEAITGLTVVGAATIVVSVALVIRTESTAAARRASTAPPASASA